MLSLFRASLIHILRSRLLVLILVFSTLVQVLGLRLLGKITLSVQGTVALIGPREAMFAALFFQLFIGFFISAVYGIWMAPYSHQGQRSSLTYVLPVSKWTFPVIYSISFLGLLLLQYIVMCSSLGFLFGWEIYRGGDFAWGTLALCLAIQALAFVTCMLGFAVSSLSFGQITTFFFGMSFLFVSQIGGLLEKFIDRFGGLVETGGFKTAQFVYRKLPPLGELVFDIRSAFSGKFEAYDHLVLWAVWLVIFMLLFRWKLRFPVNTRSSEA